MPTTKKPKKKSSPPNAKNPSAPDLPDFDTGPMDEDEFSEDVPSGMFGGGLDSESDTPPPVSSTPPSEPRSYSSLPPPNPTDAPEDGALATEGGERNGSSTALS